MHDGKSESVVIEVTGTAYIVTLDTNTSLQDFTLNSADGKFSSLG